MLSNKFISSTTSPKRSNKAITMSTSTRTLFIPRVFLNISKENIAEVFDKLDLAIVDKIDFVRKQGKNGPYNAVYIHLKYWLSTDASRRFRDKLFSSEGASTGASTGAKLMYEDPWYWVVLPNTSQDEHRVRTRTRTRTRNPTNRKTRIVLERPGLIRNAKIYPEASATDTDKASELKIHLPTTPPQTPPQTPPRTMDELIRRANDKLFGAGCNAPKKAMPLPLHLDLENMEANLFAAEALLASFGPTKRPRRDSECSE